MPSFCTTNLSRPSGGFSFPPEPGNARLPEPADRSSSSGTNASNSLAWCGTRAEPAAHVQLEPALLVALDHLLDGYAAKVVDRNRPQASCLQPENAILNFRPKSCVSGCPTGKRRLRWRTASRQTFRYGTRPPAGTLVTLRTEFPAGLFGGDADGRKTAGKIAGESSIWM